MANDKKFVVKNGLRADNVQFTDSASGLNQINVNMLNTDTLQFEGDAGTLLSISDDLTGTVFSVGDISGIPIIEAIGDTHNVTMAEFDGKVMIGTTDSGGVDSDKLNVEGTINTNKMVIGGVGSQATGKVKIGMNSGTIGGSAANIEARAGLYLEDPSNNRLGFDVNEITCSGGLYLNGNSVILQKQGTAEVLAKFNQDGSNQFYFNNVVKAQTTATGFDVQGALTSNDSAIFGGNGMTGGVKVDDGAITIRTGTGNEAYIDFYCEVSNVHRTRLKSAPHASYSGNPDVVLPTSSGTLALTSDIPSTAGFITASSTATFTNKTFDANGTGNSITNIDIGNMTAAVVVTEAEGIGSNDNDTTLPTSAAVKDYVDNNSPQSGITVQEEGSSLSTSATTLNFVGSTVTASGTGATKTITISGGGSITVQDEGSSLTTSGDTLNFVGAGVTASGTGTTKTITITGGGSGIAVQDEGSALSTSATTLNFVGAGVTASGTGATKTITISGGGGGSSAADAIIRSFIFG